MADNGLWDSMSNAFTDIVRGGSGGFGGLMQSVLPGVIGTGTNILFSQLFPGTRGQTKGMDLRTGTGQEAESLRLGAARGTTKQYNDLLEGRLDPREEYLVRKRAQSDRGAYSGGGTTGQQKVRERNAISEEVSKQRAQMGGLVGNLTGGYKDLHAVTTPGQASPWAALGGAFGGGLTKGLEGYFKKKNQQPQQQQQYMDNSNLDQSWSEDARKWGQ